MDPSKNHPPFGHSPFILSATARVLSLIHLQLIYWRVLDWGIELSLPHHWSLVKHTSRYVWYVQAGLKLVFLLLGWREELGSSWNPQIMGVSQNGTYHDIPPIPIYHQICFLSKFQFWSLPFFSQLCPLKLPQIGCKSPDLGQRHSEFPLPSQPEFPPQPEFPLPSASCAAKFFSSCTLAACSHDFNGQLVALVLWNLEGGWIVIILTKRESIGNPGFMTQNYKYQISRIWFCNDERASAKPCYIM